jgi:hypothetical protein
MHTHQFTYKLFASIGAGTALPAWAGPPTTCGPRPLQGLMSVLGRGSRLPAAGRLPLEGRRMGRRTRWRWRRCNRLGLWSFCFTRRTRRLISSSCTIRGDTYDCVLIRKKPADVAIKIGYNSVKTVEGCILNGFQSTSVKVEPTKN